ncbi:hypothetical protein MDAP_001843 [Mitosporidium daphniae]
MVPRVQIVAILLCIVAPVLEASVTVTITSTPIVWYTSVFAKKSALNTSMDMAHYFSFPVLHCMEQGCSLLEFSKLQAFSIAMSTLGALLFLFV